MFEPKSHRNRRHADGIGEPLWTLGKEDIRRQLEHDGWIEVQRA